jgi:hypothetical protein
MVKSVSKYGSVKEKYLVSVICRQCGVFQDRGGKRGGDRRGGGEEEVVTAVAEEEINAANVRIYKQNLPYLCQAF